MDGSGSSKSELDVDAEDYDLIMAQLREFERISQERAAVNGLRGIHLKDSESRSEERGDMRLNDERSKQAMLLLLLLMRGSAADGTPLIAA